jgi:polyribonucleotide nucleotidyltransferase
MKARGIPLDRVAPALAAARKARLEILDAIEAAIPAPREDISPYAPRMLIIQIDTDKIGKVIGPGGKTINAMQDETGATISVENDGTIYIASVDADGALAAKERILALTQDVEVETIYTGAVVSIQPFGAFIEVLPGQDGLCHISELDKGYVKEVTDVVQIGDTVKVKVISIDNQGRVKLSRKVLMEADESFEDGASGKGSDERPPAGSGTGSRDSRSSGRGGGGGRGGRGGRDRNRDKRS